MCDFIKVVQCSNVTAISLGIPPNTLTVSPLLSLYFTCMVTNGLVSLSITLINVMDLVQVMAKVASKFGVHSVGLSLPCTHLG